MAGRQDHLIAELVVEALGSGPLDVLDLLDRVRPRLPGPEGPFHALLHQLVRRGVVAVHDRSERGLARYGRPPANGSADDAPPDDAPPALADADPRTAATARRVADGVRDAAARARIEADVAAHLARLARQDRSAAFGPTRNVRHLLRRVDRGRPTVLYAEGTGDHVRRFVLHEGPWILAAIVAFLLVRAFLAEVFVIPSSSMEPTLLPTDRVVVWKPGGKAMPARFEIVTFERDGITYVKRVAGRGGEEIALVGGDVLIDGEVAVKPDDVRAALRFPYAAWDLAPGAPDWAVKTGEAGRVTWSYAGPALWAAGPTPRPSPGADVRLRDVYVRLEADLAPGADAQLALHYEPGPGVGNEGGAGIALALTAGGPTLKVRRPDGEAESVPPAAEGAPAGPGRMALELSYVDGIVRAAAGGWRWEAPLGLPLGYVVRPGVTTAEGGLVRARLVLDKDIHYSLAGDYAVPPFDADEGVGSYAFPIPPDHVFLLGDNTYDSRDSRFRKMGAVGVDELIGPVRFRIWPPARIGPID